MLVTESLVFATRMLLSTNSASMLKQVLWCVAVISKSCEDKTFTLGHLAKNLLDLITPIADEKVMNEF